MTATGIRYLCARHGDHLNSSAVLSLNDRRKLDVVGMEQLVPHAVAAWISCEMGSTGWTCDTGPIYRWQVTVVTP